MVGRTRYVDFRIVDLTSNPVLNLTLVNFTLRFTRNEVACTDAVALVEVGSGRYYASYNPSASGFDFVELYNAANDLRIQDAEWIDSIDTLFQIGATTVNVTEDYGGIGRLKVTQPSPQDWVLYFHDSSQWQSGNTDVTAALTATNITTTGDWATPALTVLKGMYHVVIRDSVSGSVMVVAAFLLVS